MMYKAFLVKYAEIGIKGKNRHLFEKALCVQMEHALAPVDGNFQVCLLYTSPSPRDA